MPKGRLRCAGESKIKTDKRKIEHEEEKAGDLYICMAQHEIPSILSRELFYVDLFDLI